MWICAIELCHTLEPANDIGNMRAEDSAVGVGFVDDNEFEVGKKIAPVGVMRQDTRVQHVWICENDAGSFTNGRAMRLRRVTVVDGRYQVPGIMSQGMERRKLVLGEGFGGEEIYCPCLRVFDQLC